MKKKNYKKIAKEVIDLEIKALKKLKTSISVFFSSRKYSNTQKWAFYRALIWIFEEQDSIKRNSKRRSR